MSRDPRSGPRIRLVLIVCVLLVSTAAGPVAGAPSITVDDPAVRGSTNIETASDDTYVAGWKPHTITTTVSGDSGEYNVCFTLESSTDEQEIECTPVTVSNTSETVRFEQSEWPDNATGTQTVSVAVSANNSSNPLNTSSTDMTVLGQNGDVDDDSVTNKKEVSEGTDPTLQDTDRDGLSDSKELYTLPSNPNASDTDEDGLSDGVEVNNHDTDPAANDSDGDGLTDPKELNKHGTNPNSIDTDGDSLNDHEEIHEHNTNPGKKDSDDDGLNDDKELSLGTDPLDGDTDNDGLEDGAEVHQHETNPADEDTDGDGLKDGAEVHEHGTYPSNPDTDGDGVNDATEIERGTNPVDQKFFLLAPMKNPVETAATVLGIGLLIGGGWYWWRRYRGKRQSEETTSAVGHGDRMPENDPEPSEPLTDEDHVQQLLTEHGGRMHQSDIVTETGWSKSKVSRLLSQMEDDGQITKISVGRENLITRPGDEPKHAGSALEE